MARQPIEIGSKGRDVAQNVRAIRKQRGWILEELSEALEAVGRPISAAMLGLLENEKRRVDVDDLAGLADALGVTIQRLLSVQFQADVDPDSLASYDQFKKLPAEEQKALMAEENAFMASLEDAEARLKRLRHEHHVIRMSALDG